MSGVSRETPESRSTPWLTVIGVGDDGPESLSPAARALVLGAKRVIGGKRLLERFAGFWDQVRDPSGENGNGCDCYPWTHLDETLERIFSFRGQPTVVLATGDPMSFGLGSTLARALAKAEIPHDEWTVVPAPGAFSLAAARMGWPLQDCLCVTIHGRPVERLRRAVAPGQKVLVLSANGESPAKVAAQLTADGYGDTQITLLAHMGGADELRHQALAKDWQFDDAPALNTLALDCRLVAGRRALPHGVGLPDEAFEHDGQLTKQEIRAVTLSALAPRPGLHLWDVGSGSGSIAIEWLRSTPGTTALALEQDAERVARMGRNALSLGVPELKVMLGQMPGVLSIIAEDVPQAPDVIFVGGGVSRPGMLEKLWAVLPQGGRLVANAVTLQAEQALIAFYQEHGGQLRRLAVSRLAPVGKSFERWDALAPVTQLIAEKP